MLADHCLRDWQRCMIICCMSYKDDKMDTNKHLFELTRGVGNAVGFGVG